MGKNGAGKTNLLDAIYFLCLTKSCFTGTDNLVMRKGESFFRLEGQFEIDGKKSDLVVRFQPGKRKVFEVNGVAYEKLSEHIGEFPVVMVTPYDSALINDSSEVRRKFVDSILCQLSKPYLENLLVYNKVLAQRNATLKQFADSRRWDQSLLDTYSSKLVECGFSIFEDRKEFIANWQPVLQEKYLLISNDAEAVHVKYKSQLFESDFASLLKETQDKDRVMQRTTAGIHKDDFEFLIEEKPLKRFGSQGQQKSFILSLKMAQFRILTEKLGKVPLLLLDDIFGHLDDERVEGLLNHLFSEEYGQIFITDAQEGRIESIFADKMKELEIFHVTDGRIVQKQPHEK